jgi:hypothetical protein
MRPHATHAGRPDVKLPAQFLDSGADAEQAEPAVGTRAFIYFRRRQYDAIVLYGHL